MKSSNITFSKNAKITISPRGYVTVSVRGTNITIIKEMDNDVKSKIKEMPYQEHFISWQEEMDKLEREAIKEAKLLYKQWIANRK